jgi:hypothetical protein
MLHYPGCFSADIRSTYMEEKFTKVQVQKGQSGSATIIDFKYIKPMSTLIIIYKESKNYIRFVDLNNLEKVVEQTLASPASFSNIQYAVEGRDDNP